MWFLWMYSLAWSHGELWSMNGITDILHFEAKRSNFSIPLLSPAMGPSWARGVNKHSDVCEWGSSWLRANLRRQGQLWATCRWHPQQSEGRKQWPVKESEYNCSASVIKYFTKSSFSRSFLKTGPCLSCPLL